MSKKSSQGPMWRPEPKKKVTSIGHSVLTRHNNKDAKRSKKAYRGQGK